MEQITIIALIVTVGITGLIASFIISKIEGKHESKPKTRPKPEASIKEENIRQRPKVYFKDFPIVGMEYSDVHKSKPGLFFGEAVCDYSDYDKYSICIYDQNDIQIGYIPRGQRKLHGILKNTHSGIIFCWGSIRQPQETGEWRGGRVYIPYGLTKNEVQNVKQAFELQRKRNMILHEIQGKEDNFIKALEIQRKIDLILKRYPEIDVYDTFKLPKSHFPSVVKALSENQEWQKIIELDQYEEYINELSENLKKALKSRIETAKDKILNNPIPPPTQPPD